MFFSNFFSLGNLLAKSTSEQSNPWHPGAALLGWLLPGLGHFVIGQRRRGIVIGVTISLLWLSGLLIGGVNVIDRHRSGIMFGGQILVAPGVVVDFMMKNHFKRERLIQPDGSLGSYAKGKREQIPQPDRPHSYEPSYGRVHEHGMLYTSLAGLLNLLAMVDVLYREPRRSEIVEQGDGTKPEAAT